MQNIEIDVGLTLKTLVQLSGASPHVVKYLTGLSRLPIIKETAGPGYARRYHPDAVQIIIEHMARRDSRK